MKKKKKIQLSILYTRKITIAGEGSLGYEKEFIIRRTQDQYAVVNHDGVRYVLFKDARDNDEFIVVGRKLGGNKYKNYQLISIKSERIFKDCMLPKDAEITSEVLKSQLSIMLSFGKQNTKNFNTFVKINFGIDYDHSAS